MTKLLLQYFGGLPDYYLTIYLLFEQVISTGNMRQLETKKFLINHKTKNNIKNKKNILIFFFLFFKKMNKEKKNDKPKVILFKKINTEISEELYK